MLSSIIIKVKGLGMRKNTLVLYFACLCTITLASCSTPHVFDNTPSGPAQSAPRDNIPLSLENPEFWQGSPEAVWARIQQQPLDKLTASQYATTDQINVGWIKLAIISKRYSADTNDLTQQLIAWRTDFPSHPGNNIFPTNPTLNSIASAPVPKNIALLLPLSGKLAGLGSAVRNGFLNAYYSQLAKSSYQQSISFIDTNSTVSIGALYQQAVAKGADFVVGPLTKDEVQKMMSSSSFSVPTLALNYTDLWFGTLPSNLYEFGLSPLDEAAQIADKAAQTGHSHAIIIAPDTDWGQRVVKKLSDRWKQDGGTISDTFYFSSKSNLTKDIAALLHVDTKEDNTKSHDETANDRATLEQQRRQDFDVIFLLAPPQSARQIVPLLRFYYVDKTAIFSTSIAYGGYAQPQKDFDLNGVTFLDTPWVLSGKSSDSNPEANRLFAVGHDAYLISHNISRFTSLANFPLYGQTGALTLTPKNQFYRRLAWAQFHAGHP
jgi:outer membrane PBP1 activator LpoA protein